MSDQAPKETLFVSDEELMRRLGVPEKIGRPALHELDRDPRSCFPRKDPLWGHRRYWPAVKEYLDHQYRPKALVTIRERKSA